MRKRFNTRNYDTNPIIITDMMSEISFCHLILNLSTTAIFLLVYIPISKDVNWGYIASYFLISYGTILFFRKKKITNIRTITLYNTKIVRQWDNEILEIPTDTIHDIQKTFLDFYDTRQKALNYMKPFFYLLSPFKFFLGDPLLIIFKNFYKIFKGYSNLSIFDTIVLHTQKEQMLVIFIYSLALKNELKEYFLIKGYDIDNLSIFYTILYSLDEQTYAANVKKGL